MIPSILNLTSSHTRDEVIAGSARHVRGAVIGRWAPGAERGRSAAPGAGRGRVRWGCRRRCSLRSSEPGFCRDRARAGLSPPACLLSAPRGGLPAAVKGGGGGRCAHRAGSSRSFAPPPAQRVRQLIHTPRGGRFPERKRVRRSRAGDPGLRSGVWRHRRSWAPVRVMLGSWWLSVGSPRNVEASRRAWKVHRRRIC